jgi:hypothetical protein
MLKCASSVLTLCLMFKLYRLFSKTRRWRRSHDGIMITSGRANMRGVGITQWYSNGLWAGWSVVRVPAGSGNFSFHHRVQTGSGAHPASYPMGTRRSFPGGKVAVVWRWPLTYISCRGQRMSGTSPLPQYAFIVSCSVKSAGTSLPLPLSSQRTCHDSGSFSSNLVWSKWLWRN